MSYPTNMTCLVFTILIGLAVCALLGITKVAINVNTVLAKQNEFPRDTLMKAVSECCQNVANLKGEVLRLQLIKSRQSHRPRSVNINNKMQTRSGRIIQ